MYRLVKVGLFIFARDVLSVILTTYLLERQLEKYFIKNVETVNKLKNLSTNKGVKICLVSITANN